MGDNVQRHVSLCLRVYFCQHHEISVFNEYVTHFWAQLDLSKLIEGNLVYT